ncbi:hypothetical protein, partial [Moorena sp. SIO3B2]|uniref:hypothetical protein n=1 Tax=Moorena sp. SIO3B2 TaxID=2607827 RepID=UPI00338EC68D
LPSTNPRKQTERSGYLGAGCGESRTPRFEGEVPWVIPGIDSNGDWMQSLIVGWAVPSNGIGKLGQSV